MLKNTVLFMKIKMLVVFFLPPLLEVFPGRHANVKKKKKKPYV